MVDVAFSQQADHQTKRVVLSDAELISLQGSRPVELPHILSADDFAAGGSLVRYRAELDLAVKPEMPLAILVGKVSLSARLYVNGQYAGACELGALEQIRCLHKPTLFVIPPLFWRVGRNQLEFEVYANDRQLNGLSPLQIGDANQLDLDEYRPRLWWQVSLVEYLMWISLAFGGLGLLVGLVLKQDSIYFWFGLTSLSNAVSCLNAIISRPLINIEWFSWLVFTSRFVSVVLFLLMLLTFFDKAKPWIKRSVMTYAMVGAVLIWLTGNSRTLVEALYIPCLIGALIMPGMMVYWTTQTRQPSQITLTLAVLLVSVASIFDWSRLLGRSSLEGVYFIQYAYSGTLVVVGGLLVQFLVNSLLESRELSQKLELRVAERTADLERAHQHLLSVETEHSRSKERERLVRDMHDGFGSQLVTARLMAEQGQMTSSQLGQVIDECIADLYLVIDSLASDVITLDSALANFRYRIEQRMLGKAIQLHWRFQFDGDVPALPPHSVLQILRILQEALNNIYKHAHASHIWFDFEYCAASGRLRLQVADDGIGLPSMANARRGRGLNNMTQRAREIDAQLVIANRDLQSGSLLQLTMILKHELS